MFSKNTQIRNLIKVRTMGSELLHAEGQKDMTKLIVAFRNFSNAPKNGKYIQRWTKTGFKTVTLKLQHLIVLSSRLLQTKAVLSVEILNTAK
jgi:hypothetical protein